MTNFDQFGLPEGLSASLKAMKFDTPTPIQQQAIPVALQGIDILGSAQTGTGKTGAFGVPLIAHVLNNPQASAMVLTPTRELATQVMQVLRQMLSHSPKVKTALLIGGDSMFKQLQQLKMRPRVIVGTPGRVNDHLKRGSLKLDMANLLVLDETDRMLDMGFGIQIDAILEHMPQERQTLLFSATLPKEIVAMSKRYLVEPERIAVGSTIAPAKHVDQEVVKTTDAAKYDELLKQLEKREGSIIVFVKTKYGTEKLARRLTKENHSAEAVHGDLRQRNRDRVIADFRNKRYRILVATDVAARGLDIPHIEHVINFDLPQCPEDYIHRIGRTARAGAKGQAVSLLAPADNKKWNAIFRMLNPNEPAPQREHNPRPKAGGKHQPKPFKAHRNRPTGEEGAERAPHQGWKQGKPASFRRDGEKPAQGGFKGKRFDKREDRQDNNRNEKRAEYRQENRADSRMDSRKDSRVDSRGEQRHSSGKPRFGKPAGKQGGKPFSFKAKKAGGNPPRPKAA